jgi:hypothetical protein
MTDSRPQQPAEPEPSLSETLDLAVRRMSMAVLAAGAMIGLGMYAARPAPQRFDAFAIGSEIVRVDMKTGTIISCEGTQTCKLVLKRGQKLERIHRTAAPTTPKALPAPAAPTPPAAAPGAGR